MPETTPSAKDVTVDYDNRYVVVQWTLAGNDVTVAPSRYPFVWLRDACRCAECFNQSTQSVMFTFDSLDINCWPTSVTLTRNMTKDGSDDAVVITWSDRHVTTISCSLLCRCEFESLLKELPQSQFRLWGSELGDKIPKFVFDKLITDDRTLYDWITTLWVTGICLVTETPTKPGQLQRIAERVSYLRNNHYGETFDVRTKSDPSNVAYTTAKLGMHTDLAYENYVPGMQMLHCLVQTKSQGGANQFSDGFRAAEQLRARHPDYFNILSTVPVEFYDLGTDFIPFDRRSTHRTIRLNERGHVVQVTFSNHSRDRERTSWRLPLDQVEPFYRALRAFYDLITSSENLIEIKLSEGDIVCFHNYRVLHGRSALRLSTEPESEIERHLVGGYIDWDDMLSKRRVLKRRLGLNNDSDFWV